MHGLSVPLYLEYESRVLNLVECGATDLQESDVQAILAAIVFYAVRVPIYYIIRPNLRDEKDNMVVECAANFGADYLVTHNIRDFRGVDLQPQSFDVITPREFLARTGAANHD